METARKINAALLGVRGYGATIAGKVIESECFQLSWCCHYEKEVALECAVKYSAKGTTNIGDILTDEKVEAVFIVTPNHLHFKHIKEALEAGKHVFVEKPMTSCLSEATEISQTLKKKPRVFMVGHNYRRKNGIRKIKEMIEDGTLGIPICLEMINSHGGGFNFMPDQWRFKQDTCPGGPLEMLGTHSFDTIEYLLGHSKNIYSVIKKICAPTDAPDTSSSIIEMENGTICYLSNNYNVPSCAYLQFHGSEGSIYYKPDSNILIHRTGRDINRVPASTKEIKLDRVDDRLEQIVEFAYSILFGKKIETGIKEGWRAVAFAESALASTKHKKPIEIPCN